MLNIIFQEILRATIDYPYISNMHILRKRHDEGAISTIEVEQHQLRYIQYLNLLTEFLKQVMHVKFGKNDIPRFFDECPGPASIVVSYLSDMVTLANTTPEMDTLLREIQKYRNG